MTTAAGTAESETTIAAELRVAHARLRRVEALTHTGTWRLELATRKLAWSEEVYRIFGWPPMSSPSLPAVLDSYHSDDRERVQASVERALRAGGSYASEARIVRPGGDIRHVSTFAEAEQDDDGRVVGLFGTFQDMTERHTLETELRQAQKMEAIGRLTAGIAHDFNNILQALMAGLELLLLEVEKPSQREYAEIALAAARSGAQLTQNLLAFSRQQTLQPKPIKVGRLLHDIVGLLRPSLGPKIQLLAPPAPGRIAALADAAELESAVVNLVVNAAHAMPEGGRIEVTASVAAPPVQLRLLPRAYARVSVRDTGLGMDPGVLAQCRDPSFTTKGPRGSGLGLSMVQGFVRQSGGEMSIDSGPGRGTLIDLWLPLADAGPSDGAGGRQVMVVDDAADVVVVVGAFLKHAGFTVTRAGSGRQALALLAGHAACDVLVTDYTLPELNGIDLIGAARQLRPGLPALVISGFDEAVAEARAAGLRVLRKPFARQTLLDEVDALLGLRVPTDGSPA